MSEREATLTSSAEDNNITRITLAGQLNGRSGPGVHDEIMALVRPASRILLDMSGLTYMSSAGLRILLLLHRQIEATDSRLVLVGLSEEIQDTMAITGFLDFFQTAGSYEEGLDLLCKE